MRERKGLSGLFSKGQWAISLFVAVVLLMLSSTAHAAPGDLDLSFGGTGIVTTAVGTGDDYGYGLAIQEDGKIIAVGFSHNGSNKDVALVRYNTDGTLDTAFDTDGMVTTPIGPGDDVGYRVVVQSDGKMLVSGHTHNGSNWDFALMKYNLDGSLDTSFGTGGKVTTPIGSGDDVGLSLAVQSDDRIVIAGYSNNGSNNDFAAVRYNSDGSLDTSFDGDGIVTTAIGINDVAYAVAIQPDGKIVVAGNSDNSGSDPNYFALTRYNPDGSLDATFDGDGKVIYGPDSHWATFYDVAVRADGKIVAVGQKAIWWYDRPYSGKLIRFNADGSLYMDPVVTGSTGGPHAVALQSDGQEVVTGWLDGHDDHFFVQRLQPWSSSANISVSTQVGTAPEYGHRAYGRDVAIQADGTIVVSGYALNNGNYDFAVVRYLGTGTATISGAPSGKTSSTSATLTIGGTDVVAYRYKLDSGTYSTETVIATPITLTSLGSGSHTVYVIGKSSSGYWQAEASATTATWTVDVDPPTVTGLSDDPTPKRSKTWNWSATDNYSTTLWLHYQIDQNTWVLGG